MWLACYTHKEISEAIKEPEGTVSRLIADDDFLQSVLKNQVKESAANHQTVANISSDFSKMVLENQNRKNNASAFHATDFEPPLYNVWTVQNKTNTVFGCAPT